MLGEWGRQIAKSAARASNVRSLTSASSLDPSDGDGSGALDRLSGFCSLTKSFGWLPLGGIAHLTGWCTSRVLCRKEGDCSVMSYSSIIEPSRLRKKKKNSAAPQGSVHIIENFSTSEPPNHLCWHHIISHLYLFSPPPCSYKPPSLLQSRLKLSLLE